MNTEIIKLNAEILTPVHVGSGQTLTKGFDFIPLDKKTLGMVSLNNLGALLDRKTIELFTQAIQNNQSVPDFIKTHLGAGIAEEKYVDKKLPLYAKTEYTFLKEQFHTAMKGATVPGSSLKGALKTALWRHLANDRFNESLVLNDLKKRKKDKLIWNDENIEKKLFGRDANHKLTRFLSVSDMHFGNSTQVHEIGILNMYHQGWNWKKEAGFLAETISPKAKTTLTLNLKKNWKEKNLEKEPENWNKYRLNWLNSTREFFRIMNDFTVNRTESELEDLRGENFDQHEAGNRYLTLMEEIKQQAAGMENGFILRVGGNTGWEFITGGWIRKSSVKCLSSKEGEKEYWALKKTIQKNKNYDTDIWGKTRKMTIDGIPLGFIKFTV